MGLRGEVQLVRPGYVPRGGGTVRLVVGASPPSLHPVVAERRGPVERVWGIALSSHLRERRVTARMAEAARHHLAFAGLEADIEEWDDANAPQAGAALALFADLGGGIRLGADRAGAPHRRAESIGVSARSSATHLVVTGRG